MAHFDQWWNDLKKHRKRMEHWLPHWRGLATRIGATRRLRYFTLCARPMIDIFMLVKEGILNFDADNHSIDSVRFCECEQETFDEIREMIVREDAGFLGRLEDIILFEDDAVTKDCDSLRDIDARLEDLALQANYEVSARLNLKRTFFHVRSSFPYDFINLDFCDYYYPDPPDMLRVNNTVERILDLQHATSEDGNKVRLNEFVMAVTCRHDDEFPLLAEARLLELIRENCVASSRYNEGLAASLGHRTIDEWVKDDKEDFFFSGWPKDIARAARDRRWRMEILDYVFYRRVSNEGSSYLITCLVARFVKTRRKVDYIEVALHALQPENRKLIDEIDRRSKEGRQILSNLREIVALRNEQAFRMQREKLPNP